MNTTPESRASRRLVALIFLVSTLLSLTFLVRSQAGGDQLNLLARGWLLATRGELVPYGNPASGGGVSPGPMTSIVVGLPLLVWQDARAPIILVLLFHLASFILLDRLVARCWGHQARLCFALLYGLSPLRLYLSGLLWNPSYLMLAAAIHAWTAYRQREKGRPGDSFLHVLSLGLAAQLHLSAALLGAASVLLWWRGAMKVHWRGAALGVAATALTLIPYFSALGADRVALPAKDGFLGRGLLYVYPLAHGLWNGIREASLSLPARITPFDFSAPVGGQGDALLTPIAGFLARGLGPLTLVLALVAAWRFGRHLRRAGRLRLRRFELRDRGWLEDYALCCLAGAVVLFCAAPTTPMWWQGMVMVHVFVLPATRFGALCLRSPFRLRARRIAAAWATLAVLLGLALAFGSPYFRCGGRKSANLALEERYPMLRELGMEQRCPYPIVAGAWYPDLFPPKTKSLPNNP